MRAKNTQSLLGQALQGATIALGSLLALSANAAAPGIGGAAGTPAFNLSAAAMRSNQPNGKSVYAWGYGCTSTAGNTFLPAAIPGANCPTAQMPGPTLIVNEGDLVTVTLTNNLPAAAGNTSILFPGFQVCAGTIDPTTVTTTTPAGTCTPVATDGVPGLLTQEAKTGTPVSYQFVATSPGTHSYYSGTQGDLQVEMGLYGALIVLPKSVPANCNAGLAAANLTAEATTGESDFRLAHAAYDNQYTCYDREYLFQFSEMDDSIHTQAEAQVLADLAKPVASQCTSPTGCLVVATEPYGPDYFMVNGRSMPDDMDPNYVPMYPNQPYNGNPHMHPGELTLVRIIGQGRMQHPFHEHANHVRVLARDGNLVLSPNGLPAGPLMFTTTTTPGMTMDGIFYWTGKGLNWDVFGHAPGINDSITGNPVVCNPDANGYFTSDPTAPNYYEWCGDHNKALEKHPFGEVGSGGPVTLPDPNIVTNGNWYGGSPYLGGEAAGRAVGATPIPPAGTVANSPTAEAGYAYMWHSHNEREITTANVFPGGMMMMMLVDPRSYVINESN